jgi:hypothetical protein
MALNHSRLGWRLLNQRNKNALGVSPLCWGAKGHLSYRLNPVRKRVAIRFIRVYVASPALIRSENPFSLLAATATGGGANSCSGVFRGSQKFGHSDLLFPVPTLNLTDSGRRVN